MVEEHLYCYRPEDLADLVEGNVNPEARAAFEKHLAECPACRREWIEVSLARFTSPEYPPEDVQRALKEAVRPARVRLNRARSYERSYTGARIASLAAATILVAVVIALLAGRGPVEQIPEMPSGETDVATPAAERAVREPESKDTVVEKPEQREEKREVKGIVTPEPTEEVVVDVPEPVQEEKIARVERPEPTVESEVKGEPEPKPVPGKLVEKPKESPSPLEAEKKERRPDVPAVPEEKLAFKLTDNDAGIFRKHYKQALLSVRQEEIELIEKARRDAKKMPPVMGPPIQPGKPVVPPTQPEQPKAEPKQDPEPNPNAPPPLPRIDKLRKEGKVPEEGSQKKTGDSGTNPDAPPPLPRIEELRKKGKLPPETPKEQPGSQPGQEQPKQDPKQGPKPEPARPAKPHVPTGPVGPAKGGPARLASISKEQLAKLAKEAGFEPVEVPKLKDTVILARADLVKDSSEKKVAHLFYYFGNGGFSIFERETARDDKKNSYQPYYNGKGKVRTLMWAAGGREFVLVAQKLTRKQMFAIEASVRELFE
jgi:hypothetical protein